MVDDRCEYYSLVRNVGDGSCEHSCVVVKDGKCDSDDYRGCAVYMAAKIAFNEMGEGQGTRRTDG